MYCLVENGSIVDGPKPLPKCDKTTSGLNLLDDEALKLRGWYKVVDIPPVIDEATQYLTSELVVGDGVVNKNYTTHDRTPEELATKIMKDRLDAYRSAYSSEEFLEAYFEKHYEDKPAKMDSIQAARLAIKDAIK